MGLSLDAIKDAFAERLELGMLASMPQNGPNGETAPTDALDAMGRDRRIPRGINETDAAYAVRLLSWLDDRRYAGNPFMLMKQLAGYCGSLPSFRTVDNRGNWFSRAANGTETYTLDTGNWNWDGDTTKRSRFWVIIYPNGLWDGDDQEWGTSDAWGTSGHAWGSDITQEQCATLRAIIRDWKPDGTRCVNIILAFDPASFDPTAPEPDGTWGNWSKVDTGVRVPARLTTARYLAGSSS